MVGLSINTGSSRRFPQELTKDLFPETEPKMHMAVGQRYGNRQMACPGKWQLGPPAASWWFKFDPRPHVSSRPPPSTPTSPGATASPSAAEAAEAADVAGLEPAEVEDEQLSAADSADTEEGPKVMPRAKHSCCWETCYIFACCGLVGTPHLTANSIF